MQSTVLNSCHCNHLISKRRQFKNRNVDKSAFNLVAFDFCFSKESLSVIIFIITRFIVL